MKSSKARPAKEQKQKGHPKGNWVKLPRCIDS